MDRGAYVDYKTGCLVEVRSPGFEPGLSGWEPDVLTKLDYDRKHESAKLSYHYVNILVLLK